MPSTIHKFRSNGDEQTAQLLEDVVYKVKSHLDSTLRCLEAACVFTEHASRSTWTCWGGRSLRIL